MPRAWKSCGPRRKMQRSQSETESTLSAIHSSMAVADYSTDGTINKVSSNFLELFGYTQDEVVGEHHRILATKDDKNSEDLASSGETFHRATRKKGLTNV